MARQFTGKVASLDGYLGFIQPDHGGDLIPFRELDAKSFITVKDHVEYDIEPPSGDSKELAINVTLLAAPLGRNIALDHHGGGGRGGGGRGRGLFQNICTLCWKTGHKNSQCPGRASGSSSPAPSYGKGYCDICQEHGHFTNQCPRGRGGGGTSASSSPRHDNCYKCGELGHYAIDCPKNTCYICGELGHRAKECPMGRNRRCFFCGEHGHMRGACRSLKEHGQNKCYRCSKLGHLTHECTKFKDEHRSMGGRTGGGGVGAGGECLGCGRTGHSARLCRFYFDK